MREMQTMNGGMNILKMLLSIKSITLVLQAGMKKRNITYPEVIYDQGSSYNFADEFYKRYNVIANISSQVTSWLRLNLNTKYSKTKGIHPCQLWAGLGSSEKFCDIRNDQVFPHHSLLQCERYH